jgi:hypothetical protein
MGEDDWWLPACRGCAGVLERVETILGVMMKVVVVVTGGLVPS